MSATAEEKIRIRQFFLERRRALSADDVREKSGALCGRLLSLPELAGMNAVLCYVSSKDNEVDTLALILRLLDSGTTVLTPIARRGGVMEWSHLLALEELAPSRFGILEPRPEAVRIVVPPVDAPVLVPGIAFTRDGWRIGYGGGFFDRFLARHQGPSIALAFDVQIMEQFEAEPHDIPVQVVVTESATYRRGSSGG